MKPDLSSLPEWSRLWAQHRLSQALSDISGEQWSSLGDWLTALPSERPKMPAKLHKITMAQALQASALWHENMACRAERIRANQSSLGGDPCAVEVLADGGHGWRWVRVTSPEGLDYEGNAMGHCVGRGRYDTGKTIISLRDKHNMPHCTIEWDENSRIVRQVQGRANGPVVEKYHKSIVIFVNGLEPLAVQGADKFGHVFIEGKLVHCNNLPDRLTLERLDLTGCTSLRHLPNGLTAKNINLRGCTNLTQLPDELIAERIYLVGCTSLTHLPHGLNVETINLSRCTGLTCLPDDLNVQKIWLDGCTGLTHLPDMFSAEQINIEDCTSLTHLPYGLNVKILNLSGCTGLTYLPEGLTAKYLDLKDCTGLTHLPDVLNAEFIYLNGCTGITCLPDSLNENCTIVGRDDLVPKNNPRI